MSQQQPVWGAPQPPLPPASKKTGAGKVLGFGCLGIVALAVFVFVIVAVVGGSGDPTAKSAPTKASKPTDDAKGGDGGKESHDDVPKTGRTVGPGTVHKPSAKPEAKTEPADDGTGKATFKVWGTAPAGTDTTYGSDSDSNQGGGVPMTKTLKVDSDAMYYAITAQLQGGGDIHCSVTIEGKTKTGHASGGYNICSAQLNSGLFGGFE